MDTNTVRNGEGNKILVIGAGCAGLALPLGLKKVSVRISTKALVIRVPKIWKSLLAILIPRCRLWLTLNTGWDTLRRVHERRSNIAPLQRNWNFGLHWSAPTLQSLIPGELCERTQSTQVDPHTATEEVDVIHSHNGKTGELIRGVKIERFHCLRRSKRQALSLEGLNVEWEKKIVHMTYLDDGKGVKTFFEDGTEITGSLMIGADGARSRSSVRSLLVGSDIAKPNPINFAAIVCLTKYSRQRALFLRSEQHHPLFQIAPHLEGYYSWLGLHDASYSNHPIIGNSSSTFRSLSLENSRTRRWWLSMSHI